jgi:hypothetical protein
LPGVRNPADAPGHVHSSQFVVPGLPG